MKYADSFEYSLTVVAANGADTYYSDWIDVDFANELMSNEYVVTTNIAAGGETIDITLERYRAPLAATAVLTHGQITTNATTQDEQTASSIGAGTDVIGSRVRFKVVAGGAWAATESAVITMRLYMKRN